MNASKASIVSVIPDEKCIIVDGDPCQCEFEVPIGVKAIKWDIDSGGHLIFLDDQSFSVGIDSLEKMDKFYERYVFPYIKIYHKEKDRLQTMSNRKNRCHNVKDCIKKKQYEILEKYKLAVEEYLKDYTNEELTLYPQLYNGASLLINQDQLKDVTITNTVRDANDINLLITISNSRGIKTLDLAYEIIENYKKYINIIGQLIGQKQKYMNELHEVCKNPTIKRINSIDIKYVIV